jgi:hypothetical protein
MFGRNLFIQVSQVGGSADEQFGRSKSEPHEKGPAAGSNQDSVACPRARKAEILSGVIARFHTKPGELPTPLPVIVSDFEPGAVVGSLNTGDCASRQSPQDGRVPARRAKSIDEGTIGQITQASKFVRSTFSKFTEAGEGVGIENKTATPWHRLPH